MAKYFVAFVLLALLVMENNNIYNRLHAKSQPSGDNNAVDHFMRQHHQYRHPTKPLSYHHPTHDHRQTHHVRKHAKQHPHHNTGNGEYTDETIRDGERIKRHMKQQMEHLRLHEERLQKHHGKGQITELESLKTMPRLWQHLSTVHDFEGSDDDHSKKDLMFGDAPADEDPDYYVGDYSNGEIPVSLEDNEESSKANEKSSNVGCPKCEGSRNMEMVSEEELTRLRIEFVKQQILDKLRLKERPIIPAVSLPKPILEGRTIQQEDDDSSKKDMDDYYARTSKKFIFLEVEKQQCSKLGTQPSMCFSFKLDDTDADSYEVRTAVLWIFKNKHRKPLKNSRNYAPSAENQQKIIVSEVQQETNLNQIPTVKEIANRTIDVQDEWLKIDINWPIQRWIGNHELSHLIQITCESCDMAAMEHIISTDKDYRPFIMVNTQSRKRQPRQKRNINCTHGVTECCREKLYISFAEMGWKDWIIEPKGYDAYFCRGTCNTVASVANSASQHSTFLQKLIKTPGRHQRNLELVPCCTAKTYSSLQLLMMENNTTGILKTFPNMVVESCGCR
ncbi:activin beta chain dawdle [Haematobia irritans]|uniref:activin beta chain dawdle n=1 Tax=Haematobia irritans TaxID=7368 RepID=UPI003F50B937